MTGVQTCALPISVLDWDLAVDLEPASLVAALQGSDGRCSQTETERQLGAVQVREPRDPEQHAEDNASAPVEIGRASCRERV